MSKGASAPFFGMPSLGLRSALAADQADITRVTWSPCPDYRRHSVQLNRIAWRMRRTLDLVDGGTGEAPVDVDQLCERFFIVVDEGLARADHSDRLDPDFTVTQLVQEIHQALPCDAIRAHTAVDVLASKVIS